MTPDDRSYLATHEWIKIEEDIATIGITEHAQDQLGDITFVELPSPGKVFEQGEECGVVESVKAASDIFTPISGQVYETNHALEDKPELINQDPYGDGWLIRLKNVDESDVGDLLSAEEYEASIA